MRDIGYHNWQLITFRAVFRACVTSTFGGVFELLRAGTYRKTDQVDLELFPCHRVDKAWQLVDSFADHRHVLAVYDAFLLGDGRHL